MPVKKALFVFLPFVLTSIFIPWPAAAAPPGEEGPVVGSFAPELASYSWLQKEDKHPAKIDQLRGKVVLIHTFAYLCDA